MELVFVHGWGFDASFWDPLATLLADYPQRRLERGFMGAPPNDDAGLAPAILVGHSLGFVHGLKLRPWTGWVAINGFPRFVAGSGQAGCVPAYVLRIMGARLETDTGHTLGEFYERIHAEAPKGTPDTEKLCDGLDELCDSNVGKLTGPGLVLASRTDPLVPNAVSETLAELSGAPIRWHESGGHLLPHSDPAWCAGAIKDFLAQVKP